METQNNADTPLTDEEMQAFALIQQGVEAGNLALVRASDWFAGDPRAVIALVDKDTDPENTMIIPLAILLWDDVDRILRAPGGVTRN